MNVETVDRNFIRVLDIQIMYLVQEIYKLIE